MSLFHTLNFIANHPLNQKQKPQSLLRFFHWQLASRLAPGEIVYDWIDGVRLVLRRGEWGLTGNIYCGLHEYVHMSYVLHTMTPEDLFVDVGANVGSYTLLACGVRGARGYCVEPIPSTYERLMTNLRINRLEGRVQAFPVGVGEQKGELLFVANQNTVNHVLRPEDESQETMRVEVIPLDELLQDAEPALIKVDVEGFETAVVRGAMETLRKESLHSVIMELGGAGATYGYDERDIVKEMHRLGFREYEYQPMTRTLRELREEAAEAHRGIDNTLFIRDLPRVQRLLQTTPQVVLHGLSY